MLQRDVTRTELRRHPAFEGFPFNRARLVNPFELNDAQVDAIYDLSEDLVSV
jgi:hypothetical protein